jgi:predicted metal-dependent HD superfamily phosphohydrolase
VLSHLHELLARYDEVARDVGWAQPCEVFWAILFHDFVYQAGAQDNEARSAEVAQRCLAALGPVLDVTRVVQLIELTARHGSLREIEVDREAALFLDCDMAILGADAEAFSSYDRKVAKEYASLDPEIYEAGRRAFLTRLLGPNPIFLSAYFRARREAAARANLERRLASTV